MSSETNVIAQLEARDESRKQVEKTDEICRFLIPISIVKSPHSILSGDFFVNFYNGCEDSEEKKQLFEITSNQQGYPTTVEEPFLPAVFNSWLENSGIRTELMLHSHSSYAAAENAQLVLYFGTSSFIELIGNENANNLKSKECMTVAWGEPRGNIPTLAGFSTGVIGREDYTEPPFALENDKLPFLSGFKIPQSKSLKLQHFVVTRKQYNLFKGRHGDYYLFKKFLGLENVDKLMVKGIVFMHAEMTDFPDSYMGSRLFNQLQDLLCDFSGISLAGGIFPKLFSKGTPDEDVVATGFLVLGPFEKVKVQCTFFNETQFTPKDLSKLTQFKENMLKPDVNEEESSFAVFFGSHERGMKLYDGAPAVEPKYLQAVFPKTLLTGAYVPFQFCRDHVESKLTSVFFLVSYLRPKI